MQEPATKDPTTSQPTATILLFFATVLFSDQVTSRSGLPLLLHYLASGVLVVWACWLLSPTFKAFALALGKGERPAWTRLANMVSLVFAVLLTMMVFRTGETAVTPESVEGHIRTWLDHFGLSSRTDNSGAAQEDYFRLVVTTRGNQTLMVVRSKEFDRYVVMNGTLRLATSSQELLGRVPAPRLVQLVRELRLELARAKLVSTINASVREPVNITVRIDKRLPITSDLTEDVFISGISELEWGLALAEEVIRFGAQRALEETEN